MVLIFNNLLRDSMTFVSSVWSVVMIGICPRSMNLREELKAKLDMMADIP